MTCDSISKMRPVMAPALWKQSPQSKMQKSDRLKKKQAAFLSPMRRAPGSQIPPRDGQIILPAEYNWHKIDPRIIMANQPIPFGLWRSPIAPTMIGSAARLNDLQFSPDGNFLVWSQSQDGKTCLLAQQGKDAPIDLSGEFNPRGAVGYGGGEFFAGKSGIVFADRDGRLYAKAYATGLPKALTPGFGGCASPVLSSDETFVVFVHSYEGRDVLAAVESQGKAWPKILTQGADFYMHPALSPDGSRLAWVEWDHPNMPWDGARLMIACLDAKELRLSEITQLAGDENQAVFQPIFSPDGTKLAWLQNSAEFDDLVVFDLQSGQRDCLLKNENLLPPAWVQGIRVLAWSADSSQIFYLENHLGSLVLKKISLETKVSQLIATPPYTLLEQIAVSSRGEIGLIGQSAALAPRILVFSEGQERVAARSLPDAIPEEYFSAAQSVQWTSSDGVEVHGLYYPPANPDFSAEGAPPMITFIHGGPTSQSQNGFSLDCAFFTSRGYAFLMVNYRGSTGYGRAYRDALRNNWGKLDLQDAIEGSQAMVDRGLADPGKLVIKGSSAGGYTVLNALAHHPGFFKAGICMYGVSNLFLLEMETHKFEEHYNKSLVGSLPETAEKFYAWSPVFHAEKIRDALAVFQGDLDVVVPPSQSEAIVRQLKANGVPYIYKLYEGEGHGFRKKENLTDFYETVDQFLKQNVIFSV
jgi:dipeptidyl aminopeptidase/acylaminoacyl peptidase